jgi:hypothetical protein
MVPIPAGSYSNQTGTIAVTSVPAVMAGFYVNSTSSGTIVFRDGGASGTVVSGTITPAIGWHFFPVSFARSVHITIANTLDVTLCFAPTPTT